jgi:hypothetical protein
MYDMFIELAASNQRPLVFDIRRIETKSTGTTVPNTSAEAFARKQAVIAAAEAREKAAKKLEKPVAKRAAAKKDDGLVDLNADVPNVPQSEEARRAVEAAKRGESTLAAQLGYNPYETNKSTAGQARNATVATETWRCGCRGLQCANSSPTTTQGCNYWYSRTGARPS